MKTRDQIILDQLIELCEVNQSVEFDVSVPIEGQENEIILVFDDREYALSELNITLHEIEWLQRLGKIALVHKLFLKSLNKHEFSRTTYSVFIPPDTDEFYELVNRNEWRPITVISLIGGVLVCLMAVVMIVYNVSLSGYDTHYGGGYSYNTLTPYGALLIGVGVLSVGLFGMPRWWKK